MRPPEVSLREVREEDLEAFFHQQLDSDAAQMAAFPARDRDEHSAHWERILEDPTVITRTIAIGDDVAGNIGSWVQDGHQEIGYWIGKPYWGRGVATTALRAFLEIVSVRPLYAWVVSHNSASIRVLEKSGFVREGRQESHLIYKLV